MLSVLVQTELLVIKKKVKNFMTASKMLTIISRMIQRNNFQQTAINSANMEKIKNMQWNCRGLSNKISELLVFLKEKDNDTVCLNEVQSWQNENLNDDYFVVTEMRASKSHGSMILAKKGTTIIEVCRNGKLNLSVFFRKKTKLILTLNSSQHKSEF